MRGAIADVSKHSLIGRHQQLKGQYRKRLSILKN